jgi:Uncharacterized conserved protein
MKNSCAPLEDIQSTKAKHPLAIDKVGIKDFHIPLVVRDLANEKQHSIAKVDMSVDLPADFKGTHMSRFIEALEEWRENSEEKLDYASLKNLLEQVRNKLNAQKAYLSFNFPYFITKKAPVSHAAAPVSYQCRFTGEWDKTWDKPAFLIEIEVPVTTVCPCSKAISKYGAHGQRTYIKMHIKLSKFSWIEEFVHIAEQAGSAPIYAVLKRPDEKFVTEQAYENAYFVEDVVRTVAYQLDKHEHVEWYTVIVESCESIHGHNAFAMIEKK